MNLRKLKRFIYIMLSTIFILSNTTTGAASAIQSDSSGSIESQTSTDWPAAPSVTAESAIVMDISTGLVLYEKNSKEAKYPASITKIMTTLLALENSSLNDTVTFSRDAVFGVDLDSSRIGIDVGEQLSMEDSLYGIMLASANEVSYAVAEHVSGTMEAFVDLMNERAQELGCVNTNFTNPHGLQDPNHYTCAYDMALIAQEAIKNTTFAQITGARTYVIPPTNLQVESRPLANHHKFLKRDLIYEGAIGGKTGYTSAAKYTLVTYAKRGDMELVCVVMASDSITTEYTDTSALLDYAFDNFSIYSISTSENELLSKESPLFTQYSTIFNADHAFLTTGENGYVVLPNYADFNDATKEVTYQTIDSLNEGDNVIGRVTYTYQGMTVGQTDIIYRNTETTVLPTRINSLLDTQNQSTVTNNRNKLQKLLPTLGIVVLSCAVIGFVGYYLYVQHRRIKRRNAYLKRRKSYKRNFHDFD